MEGASSSQATSSATGAGVIFFRFGSQFFRLKYFNSFKKTKALDRMHENSSLPAG
jgi:cyanophycinase-like exopeptidase